MTDSEAPPLTPVAGVTARLVYAGARVLAEHPDGIPAREIWTLVSVRLPGISQEWEGVRRGTTSAEQNFNWYSVDLVKAGWVHKTGRRWYLTAVGRAALDEYPDASSFYRRARELYVDWDRNKARFALVKRLIEGLPEGSWVAAPALATEVSLDTTRLLHWLQGERPEGWHRVLDPDGGLPDAIPLTEPDRERWLRLLEDDGIHVIVGRADPSRGVPGGDLRQLLVDDVDEGTEPARRAWLVRGANVQGENLVRSLWLPQGICSLSATRLRDLPTGAARDVVKAAIDEDYAHASSHERARLTAEYHAFLTRVREEDIVITNSGGEYFLGVVTSPPAFVTSVGKRANLQRRVDWHNQDDPVDFAALPDEVSARVSNPDADVIELTEFIGDLETLLGEEPEQPVTTREFTLPDATPEMAEALLIDQGWLHECVELLRDRPQLVFYGPPGTGKTYLAQALADHLTGGKPENVQLVQFHPAYSYEDFFEGYRPRTSSDGPGVSFELTRGPLRRLAEAARARPDEPYVLIIDEINRGHLAKVFGELYFLLEYRNRAVNLLYGSDEGRGFTLPKNLLILGTMNTADRSIALVDTAMRRRFAFVELHPNQEPIASLLARWLNRHDLPNDAARLLDELNARIRDRDFRIGPSYLMRPAVHADPAGFARVWRTQILPLLEEHHYGDGIDVGTTYGLDTLRDHLGLKLTAHPDADAP
ncbi:MAG TPA: AAA family ATPase [Micromonosporaceae bacterium]|nr:AAA family ATPase [Micromonosporaceae bacterium]